MYVCGARLNKQPEPAELLATAIDATSYMLFTSLIYLYVMMCDTRSKHSASLSRSSTMSSASSRVESVAGAGARRRLATTRNLVNQNIDSNKAGIGCKNGSKTIYWPQ